MNDIEQHLLVQALQADTPTARKGAIREMLRMKGVRISAATRAALMPEVSETAPARALRHHKADALMARLAPGPRPVMPPTVVDGVAEWLACWRGVDALRAADVDPPGALLLHGPPGTGKTMLTRWLSTRFPERPAFVADAHDWLDSHFGESGSRLAAMFAAVGDALLVLEEIDTVGSARRDGSAASQEGTRITVALMRLIEAARGPVVLTTNRIDSLDTALLRRCDAIVEMPEPSSELKAEIVRGIAIGLDFDFDATRPLVDLVREAKRARRLDVLRRAGIEEEP